MLPADSQGPIKSFEQTLFINSQTQRFKLQSMKETQVTQQQLQVKCKVIIVNGHIWLLEMFISY